MAGKKRKKNSKPDGSSTPQDKKVSSTIFESEDDAVVEQRDIQEPNREARQVEGYYSNDDVTILLDALLKCDELERIRGGDEQDIIRNLEIGENMRTMVLAPIAEDSEEAIGQLILDIDRAYRHNVEQILVPINIPTIHWYTIQLRLSQLLDWRSLEATVHDSLGIRKNSVVVNRLAAQGIIVTKHIEGSLPKIQAGESGAKNVYCGGYTSRLIANLVADSSVIGEDAWGCPNNIDAILRQEDAGVVSKYNPANAGNFGRGAIALSKMVNAAQTMSLLRGFIAKEKEFKLLREFKAIYRFIPTGTKLRITALAVPEDPAKLAALVRELHGSLPILKILFQEDKSGEIEIDAQGQLKLDSNVEIDHIYDIMVELQKKCFEFERIGIAESKDDEDPREDQEPEDIKKGLDSSGSVLHKSQPLYKGDSPEAADSLFNAGVAYFEMGDSSKALDYHELALKMRRSLYRGEHAEIATSLYSIGSVYQSLGDYIKSLDYYESSLNMRRSLYGDNHDEVAASLHGVGDVYQELKDTKKALEYYGFALKIRQFLHRGDHHDTADSLYKVGYNYRKLGDTKKALSYHRLALKMRQSLYKSDNPEVADSLLCVGCAYQRLGDTEKSLNYLEPALQMMRSLYKGDHPEIATSLYKVGTAYHALGKVREALNYLEPALQMRQELYKGDNLDVAASLHAVGAAYLKLRDYRKALDYLEPALRIMRSFYEDDCPKLATSFHSVGVAYYKLGYAEEALNHLEPALEMRQSLYKGNHVDVAASLHNLGVAHQKLRNYAEALRYKKLSLKMKQSLYKGNNVEVSTSLHSVGIAYQSLGNTKEALSYLKLALEMMQSLYEGDRPEVATALYDVGFAYYKLEDGRNAIQHLEAALKMQQSIYDGDHTNIVNSLQALSIVYKKLGEVEKGLAYQERANDMMESLNRQKQEEEFKGRGTLSYVDTSYFEYYNTGLDLVLGLRLKSLGYNLNTALLKSQYFDEGLGSGERLVQDVMITFSGRDTKVVLVPINSYNRHWLGLSFKNLGTIVEVTYMDSEQGAMLPQLKEGIERGLAVNGYESKFEETRLEQQRYNNCGLEAIENFVYYLTGARATQETAVYVHSLLVENSLLDPKEYGLKIEENNELIGFLSNVASLPIRSIDVHFLPSSNLIRGSLRVKHEYDNGVLVADGQVALDLLPAIELFNSFSAKWVQAKLGQVNAMVYKTTLGFKVLDLAVDSARLAYEPSLLQAKKLALDCAQLHGLMVGANGYSLAISGAETAYQLHNGEYQKACDVAAGAIVSMTLPVILAHANRPYLGFAYSLFVAASTAYKALGNAYSFALELELIAGQVLDRGNNGAIEMDSF